MIGALFLSIWNSILFWNNEIGISALLFTTPMVYITIKLLKGKTENKNALLLAIPIIMLSSTYFIFDNPVFKKINIIVIPVLYVIMIILATSTAKAKSMIYKIILMVIEPFNYFGEVFAEAKNQIMQKFNIKKEKREKKDRPNFVKAIFFTIIIVLVVLSLLISADTEFAKLFKDFLKEIGKLSVPTLAIRIGVIIFLFFYIAGFFINMLSKYNVLKEFEEEEVKQTKESFTIRMILTALNIIYVVFCYIQIKSLFTIENIKYSEYARRGFFQLMMVSLINILMILKATNKELIETEKQNKYKKIMCIAMLVFTLIIIISSFTRMSLYQQKYGDTRLRILVDCTLITEMILLIPTTIYIIKPKINLAKAYFIIIIVMYCIINFANIDNMIAKNNIDRYIETGKIDLNYLTYELNSYDVMKQLVRLKNTEFKYTQNIEVQYRNKQIQQEQLKTYLLNRLAELEENTSWQEFNLSKFNAKILLKTTKY